MATNSLLVLTHIGQEILPNKRIKGGSITHVGQIYFDQALIDSVSTIGAYKENANVHLNNKNDIIMAGGTVNQADNVVEYALLGNSIADGIFAWINFGVDASTNRSVQIIANCSDDGCVTNEDSFFAKLAKGLPKGKDGKGPVFPPGFPPKTPFGGEGKGFAPPDMMIPKLPEGGIPGYEASDADPLFSGGFPGGFPSRK
jgi:hypothetical protein